MSDSQGTRVTPDELIADFKEALKLLTTASPNRFLIDEEEYWERYNKLMDKYVPPEADEESR